MPKISDLLPPPDPITGEEKIPLVQNGKTWGLALGYYLEQAVAPAVSSAEYALDLARLDAFDPDSKDAALILDFAPPNYLGKADATIGGNEVNIMVQTSTPAGVIPVRQDFGSLVTFTRASSATFVASDGFVQSASTNVPRIDHDPDTGAAKGLLIEEQRANLLLRSANFADAVWQKQFAEVFANTDVSPDGTGNATRVEFEANALAAVFQSVALPAGTYTFSIWLRGFGNETVRLLAFNITDGERAGPVIGLTPEWRRHEFTVNVTAAADMFYLVNGSAAAKTFFAWGAQVEEGAFATSYIPTAASQVTRSADFASITGSDFSQWYNQLQGSFVFDGTAQVSPNSSGLLMTAQAATDADAVAFRVLGASETTDVVIAAGGLTVFDFTNVPIEFASSFKSGLAFASNNAALTVDGGIVETDANLTLPNVDRLLIGSGGSFDHINGCIKSLRYWPTRLPDAQLQGLTA